MIANNTLEMTWKDAVVANFEVLSQHVKKCRVKPQNYRSPGREYSRVPPDIKVWYLCMPLCGIISLSDNRPHKFTMIRVIA
jgi:hypothetical protein